MSISLISRKGGVGKTLLACLIAETCARSASKVRIADLDDGQRSSKRWCETRNHYKLRPQIGFEYPTGVRDAALLDQVGCLIFDGPRNNERKSFQAAVTSDLTVLPCRPCSVDFWPTLSFARKLEYEGVPRRKILVVFNQVIRQSPSPILKLRDLLQEHGPFEVAQNFLPLHASYQEAMDLGYSPSEVSNRLLRIKSKAVGEEILRILLLARNKS